MTPLSLRLQYILCLALLKSCTNLSRSVEIWLIRRWDYITSIVQTSSEVIGSWSSSPLIVNRDSFIAWTRVRFQFGRNTVFSNGFHLVFLIFYSYYHRCLCIAIYDLSALDGCWSQVYIRRILYNILMCPFYWTDFADKMKVVRPKTGLTTPVE